MAVNVAIIGHFGGNEEFFDGQTVKTKTLMQALSKCEDLNIIKIDTYYVKKDKLAFLKTFVKGLIKSKNIIICVSKNGRKMFFPIMYICSKLFGKRVFHSAIGGRLYEEVKENKNFKKYISSFEKNWVEAIDLEQRLHEAGIANAEYLPNFKCLNKPEEKSCLKENDVVKFCVFSRITQEKGVEDDIEAVEKLNEELGFKACTLSLYGPVENGYEQRFNSLVEGSKACEYCGIINPNESVKTVSNYDALLFSTHRKREGIPGTIIDSLSAGVPVIARRWRYCDEMLEHKKTGYCYDFENKDELISWMRYAIEHKQELYDMRENCLEKAWEYSDECVVPKMKDEILGRKK